MPRACGHTRACVHARAPRSACPCLRPCLRPCSIPLPAPRNDHHAAFDQLARATPPTRETDLTQGHQPRAGTVADVVERSQAQRHVYLRTVRFADIDSQDHVNNVRFLDYLEDARFGMFHIDPYNAGEEPFKGLVVTRHEIDYRRPLGFRAEPVRVETWVTEVRSVRFTIQYEILDDSDVYVTATSVLAAYDVERAAPRRLTESELAYLKRFS